MGKRVLVLTIDPARRLATALGIANSADDVRVPWQRYRGQLWAGTIDPARIFAEYIERHASDRTTAERLFGNALYQQMSTTLSGSQEFTSLSRLHDAATSGDYDLVILDTPPAAHAVDFLRAPEAQRRVRLGHHQPVHGPHHRPGSRRHGLEAGREALSPEP